MTYDFDAEARLMAAMLVDPLNSRGTAEQLYLFARRAHDAGVTEERKRWEAKARDLLDGASSKLWTDAVRDALTTPKENA